jgi:predicted nucleotidyltransferase
MTHMDMASFREKLAGDAYAFLREDPNLGENILILTVAGSVAYGTDEAGSDVDLRGVAVETAPDVLGLNSFEQFEDRATDTVVYGLKKFIRLCLNCNPNVMELLGTREEHCVKLSEEGRLLRNNAGLFLSKRAAQSFGNYATAQLHRLQNALARGYRDDGEAEEHILHRVQNQMAHIKRNFRDLSGGELELYVDRSEKMDRDTEIFMDIRLKRFPLRDFKTIYSDLSAVVRDYSSLNHRNSKRDEPHLYKHAMHLLRLLATGTDILDGKGIVTYRCDERDLFRSIRRGEMTFEAIFRLVDEFEARFKQAAASSKLPDAPDAAAVEALMLGIYRKRLLSGPPSYP